MANRNLRDSNAAGIASPFSLESQVDDSNDFTNEITIRNIQLPFGLKAPTMWNIVKEQPALVSVTFGLAAGFSSAANGDALDDSTIHYGTLSKRIRSINREGQYLHGFAGGMDTAIQELSVRRNGTLRLTQALFEIDLPKASTTGDGVKWTRITKYVDDSETLDQLTFRELEILTLIGLNDYERQAKQPVKATLTLDLRGMLDFPALFGLQHKLVKIIEPTNFGTLESLIEYTAIHLQQEILRLKLPCTGFYLKLSKPQAIAFADAPSLAIRRRIPFEHQWR